MNFVLLGFSAHGFMTIQVGPFSALKNIKDHVYLHDCSFASKWPVLLSSPDHAPLLGHVGMLGGRAGQEAGGTSSFCTADADKVPGSYNLTGRLSGHFVGDHGVLADLLQDLQQTSAQDSSLDLIHLCAPQVHV